jgi:uncharacterized metal-binding protein
MRQEHLFRESETLLYQATGSLEFHCTGTSQDIVSTWYQTKYKSVIKKITGCHIKCLVKIQQKENQQVNYSITIGFLGPTRC